MEVAEIEPNMQVDPEVEDSKQIQDEDREEKQENQIEKKSNTISEGEGDNDENEENKESELSPEEQQLKDLRFLQGYWKLPSIAQFIKIFYPILGINQMSPQELEQCILKPEVDGTLGTLIQKLIQKPSLADNDKVISTNNARSTSHHIPILNDMKEYRNWNEKLARKMSYMYKIYKRFVVKYDLKGNISCDENSKDSGYTSDILKHLINYFASIKPLLLMVRNIKKIFSHQKYHTFI